MLRDCDPKCKTSNKTCPQCGTAGNFTGHGGYERWFDNGSDARRVRVNRVKCRSCGKTHALIWHNMVPYKLRSEELNLRVFRSWAEGTSMSRLMASTKMAKTSLRQMLSHVRSRLSLMLARPPNRVSLAAAIVGVDDAALSSTHLARFGRMLAESANPRNRPQACAPMAGRTT